jgi:hypothetical protein
MDISTPKGPAALHGKGLISWARSQLVIASDIVDNPGGGLLFATQAIGQVRSALHEEEPQRWAQVAALLERAEDAAIHRDFEGCRKLLDQARGKLK